MGIKGNTLITFKTNYQAVLPNECPSTYILFPAKLKGEVRPFWNGKAQTQCLSHELSLICESGNKVQRNVQIPVYSAFMGIKGNTLITFKTNYQAVLPNECPSTYILFPAKLKGEVRPFWNGKAQTQCLSHELSLICESGNKVQRNVQIPVYSAFMGIKGNTLITFKINYQAVLPNECPSTKFLMSFLKAQQSVFLQMLHQFSVPSSKTPLYFFQLNHYILCSKETH